MRQKFTIFDLPRNIPEEIDEACAKVKNYFDQQGMLGWAYMGLAARVSLMEEQIKVNKLSARVNELETCGRDMLSVFREDEVEVLVTEERMEMWKEVLK
jgi:hypothetical protein